MGEIRSTMDIIMEKAKGLTVSDEEKRQFREQEMTGKIRGLVQRSLDGVMAMDRFRVEMSDIQEKDRDMADRLLREEVLTGIEPGKGNEIALAILREILGMDTGNITERLEIFSRQIEAERSSRAKLLMERLEKRGISGSAVIPNIEADPVWRGFLAEKQKIIRKELI
jgi:hypothetical protein